MKKLLAALAGIALSLGVQAEDKPMARVVTDVSKPVSCISAVAINMIDGEAVAVSPQQFEIEPGTHTMTGRTMLDLRYCTARGRGDRIKVEPLEAVFEAGRTYYVGFDHSSARKEDWELVVWKVED
jgi:hypothetical protein